MTQPFLDSIVVDGSIQAVDGFIGSGAQLTGIPENVKLPGLNTALDGTVSEQDTIRDAIGKLANQVSNIVVTANDANYVHTQTIATNTWIVSHPLNKYASITVVDSNGYIIGGDVHYDSLSQITVSFTSIFSGKAFLN